MDMEKEINELKNSVQTLRDNVHILLGRNNDFTVKVINGKTDERLASELIGEMYVAIKELKKETPKKIWSDFGASLMPLVQLLTLIGLLITMFKVFS